MSTFPSSVWDRLIGPSQVPMGHPNSTGLTLEQYKRVIARDLEALLNTRVAIPEEELAPYPFSRNSIVNFGLADFAQLCLTSSEDRKEICDRLRTAIERHEPRLRHVRAQLLHEPGAINRLSFAISGQLHARAENERIQFDVTLEPSRLHYSIR
ncbi:type VI secretion system baseplate subunit TssE [Rugamonas rubra]|uniref:Type VI secretion system protein ImpF n=1 Tax=Rugamonas rubra TaxID=758825 RepID=A0A1I4NNV5_9BURK|nr:type VI secretion system baseplate subunit TssE [Rugamonas rubra]SFM16997.1 type VI secretion system protein ImpF [Rugamonas rubra]